MSGDLQKARIDAASASGGTSAEPIYDAVLARVDALGVAGTALDFGAGTGRLAARLAGRGLFTRVDAADLVEYTGAGDGRVRWVIADLNDRLPVADATYDLVVAAEVIEHLENPRFVAREWFRLLRPGGWLVASTPNNESWRSVVSLLFRGHFAAFTGTNYPAHVTALLRADLARILGEAGFGEVGFTFTEHGAVPKLTSLTWQGLSRGLLSGVRYSDNVVCTARKPR
ncbi:MAG TPA: methyltransferase domain-containing protein [Longimicrobiaceae bacterium]|nr:methyltransferase domain-containing protein [Longimicrobiaceae bacterium]